MENYSDDEMPELGAENEMNENMLIVNDINNILNTPFLSDAFANTVTIPNVIMNPPTTTTNNVAFNGDPNVQN
jgi:hypothetical protein